jgi:hypothetical protein
MLTLLGLVVLTDVISKIIAHTLIEAKGGKRRKATAPREKRGITRPEVSTPDMNLHSSRLTEKSLTKDNSCSRSPIDEFNAYE